MVIVELQKNALNITGIPSRLHPGILVAFGSLLKGLRPRCHAVPDLDPERNRERTPRARRSRQPAGLDLAGQRALLQQIDLHEAALAQASRLIRELRASVTELQARERETVDWLSRVTRRVARLEEAVLGRAGSAPVTPPDPPEAH